MPGPISSGSQLDGFPCGGFGDRYVSVIDHAGPASYASVVTGSPPTGGDSLVAAEFGLKFLSAVYGGLSDDGQFVVYASPKVGGRGEAATWVLIWIVANTGAQVTAATNLSARRVRLFAIGR